MWCVVDEVSGKTKAVYAAGKEDAVAIVNDSSVADGATQDDKMASEAELVGKDLSEVEAAGVGFKVVVRDFNVWVSKDGGKEAQVSFNGSKDPYDETSISRHLVEGLQ